MTVKEISLEVMTQRGTDIFDPGYWTYRNLLDKLKRKPVLADFPTHDQERYAEFEAAVALKAMVLDPRNSFHIRFNHGARAGSIAKIVKPADMYGDQKDKWTGKNITFKYGAKILVEWDDGKTWVFDLARNVDKDVIKKSGGKHHDLLINYTGPTTKQFEKKARVVLPPAQNPDAYGRIIEIGHWVMDNRFRIGRVQRISEKGTMWIKFVAQAMGTWQSKTYVEQFGRSSSEVLILELPEGFEVTSTIMDNDVTDFEIVPTFRFGYPGQ